MREGKRDFGLFFTDASFDHKSKTAVIGLINADNSKTYSYSIKARNPQEAEEYGIEKAMQVARQEKIFNLIVFCDNKYAIEKYEKRYYEQKNQKDFWKIQFTWLPREYNQIADMLSKNISEKDVGSLIKMKEDNLQKRTKAIDKRSTKKYIKEIEVEKTNTAEAILYRIAQFKALYGISLSSRKSPSLIVQELISESMSLAKIEDLILEPEHIDDFENEIKYLSKDPYIGAILKSIRDTVIFF